MTGRSRMQPLLAALPLLVALSGCATGFLRPRSSLGLPSRAAPTAGGGLIEARDGELYAVPARDDVGAALGVGLEDDPRGGVRVTNRLRQGSGLVAGDRIVAAAALLGPEAGPGSAADPGAESLAARAAGSAADSAGAGPADVRRLPGGHEVRTLADLHGYGAARGWGWLRLGVLRGERPLSVVVHLERPRERLGVERAPAAPTARPFAPGARATYTRFGYELGPVAALPPEHRPAAARAGDQVVLFVAQGSPAAVAGLRPLDLCSEEAALALAEGSEERVEVRAGDGTAKAIRPDWPAEPIDIWIPLLFSYQWDGARRHVGVGPLDLLVHFVTDNVYDPEEDEHARAWRTSVLGTFQRVRERRRTGSRAETSLNPLVDLVRLRYFVERCTGGEHTP